MKHWVWALGLGLAVAALPSGAQPSAPQLAAEQLAKMEIKTEKVGDGLYVMFGNGGNIVVSVGTDGVLIVDDGQFPQLIPRNLEAIRALGGHKVDLAINTHWHVDHSEGNLVLGPTGTWFVSQANSREMLTKERTTNTVL